MRRTAVYTRISDAVHAVQPHLTAVWRRRVLACGSDVTEHSIPRRCLVLAPHPDDETLGCGATIARKRAAGTSVTVVIAADGRYSHRVSRVVSPEQMRGIRSQEAINACRRLGLDADDVVQLGFEDTHLDRSFDQLVSDLRRIVIEVDPEEVLVVSGRDHHPDHRTLNRAFRDVAAQLGLNGDIHVAEYPVWFWADGPWLGMSERGTASRAWHLLSDPLRPVPEPRPELVSTEGFLAVKESALAEYRSQITNLTGEPGWPIMDRKFLAGFLLSYEVFFPDTAVGHTRSPAGR